MRTGLDRMKKSIGIALILIMILGSFLVIPAAAEEESGAKNWIVLEDTPGAAVPYALDDHEYATVDEAVIQMRGHLKQRDTAITLYVQTTDFAEDTFYYEICLQAMEHTGTPTEGDYIRYQINRISASYSWRESDGIYYIILNYTICYDSSAEQESQLESVFNNVMEQLDLSGKTDYQKIKAIYDYITANIVYDYDGLNDADNVLKLTAYAALVNRTCVCQGYANLFYRMALTAGVDCRIIEGIGNGGNHAWNIVRLNGSYYNVDSTWDATAYQSGSAYQYFLKCEDTFDNHTRSEAFQTQDFQSRYPMAESDYVDSGDSYEYVQGDFKFSICNEEATLTAYTGNAANVVIPDTANGVPVKSIGYEAFRSNTTLECVTIPASVTTTQEGWCEFDFDIGKGVYYGSFACCTNLKQVILPENSQLSDFGGFTFYGCSNLSQIAFPKSIRSFGKFCFARCTALESINLPEGFTTIGQGAFSYSGLKTIHIPQRMCTSLTTGSTWSPLPLPKGTRATGHTRVFCMTTSAPPVPIPAGRWSIIPEASRIPSTVYPIIVPIFSAMILQWKVRRNTCAPSI